MAPYEPAAKSTSNPETLEISTIEPLEDFSRNGTAAATAFTVCIMSVRNDCSHVSAESPTASALTLQTRASMPPSSAALDVTHAVKAGPSATSSARPNALTPFACNEAIAAATSSTLRAQMETCAPSAANLSAIARPIPLLPPVTTARFPLSPRFMCVLPEWRQRQMPPHEAAARQVGERSPGSIPRLAANGGCGPEAGAEPGRDVPAQGIHGAAPCAM